MPNTDRENRTPISRVSGEHSTIELYLRSILARTLKPATSDLEGHCSILLSYEDIKKYL